MKKKGFTLIELLAVIVILAILALILMPMIQDLIASAREAANQRSVEGHVSNVEYAIMTEAFDNGKEISYMDGIITTLTLSLPDNDKITCSSYAITEGTVYEAKECTNIPAGWNKYYNYKKGEGVVASNTNPNISNNMLDYLDLTATSTSSYGDWEKGRTASLTLDSGSYLVYLSYADAYPNNTGGVNSNGDDMALSLSYGTADCSLVNGKLYSVSGTHAWTNNVYTTIMNSTNVFKCNLTETTIISYTRNNESYNHVPQGIIITAVKLEGNNNLTDLASNSNCSDNNSSENNSSNNNQTPPTVSNTETDLNGTTVYSGNRLTTVTAKYFNVSTGRKCTNEEWTANGGGGTDFMNTGCLRFWAYMEDDFTYTMILDRNTRRCTPWASSGSNTLGPVDLLTRLNADTGNWKGTITPSNYTYVYMPNGGTEISYTIPYDTDGYKARIITSAEIAQITHNTGFNSLTANSGHWFYLDGYAASQSGASWQTRIATSSQPSAYAWLFNYTTDGGNGCLDYGCYSTANASTAGRGYWTSDAIAGGTSQAWIVDYMGELRNGYNSASRSGNVSDPYYIFGIRPVITVLKSSVD